GQRQHVGPHGALRPPGHPQRRCSRPAAVPRLWARLHRSLSAPRRERPLAGTLMLGPPQIVALLLAILRLAELALAAHNTARLKAAGGVERGAGHYPLIVAFHSLWLLWIFLLPQDREPNAWLLALLALLLAARLWVISSLGRYWTTRVIEMPDQPLVRRGPYRWLRHPNYLVVQAEIMVVPAAFQSWEAAIGFGLVSSALLAWRIRIEEKALAGRS